MEIEALYDIYKDHPVVITDSRKPEEGSLFFALRGERFNGNTYALDALEGGAAFAVVDDPSVAKGDRFILVEDSLRTLQELARYRRSRLDIPVVAITGSNGKTTTKELATRILSTQLATTATSGNLNNHIGVPLTLLGIDDNAEIAIIEMGANHVGEIALLCNIAMPDYGLITNIGMAHLEGFGSLEGVKKAKGELYDYLEKNGGLIFINEGDEILNEMLQNYDGGKICYGGPEESIVRGEVLKSDPVLGIRMAIGEYGEIEVDTGLVGSYNLENILAAASIGVHFGIGPQNIQKAISNYRTDNNRSQQLKTDHNVLILDCYNANPTSMRAAIENFRSVNHPNKVVILGDMLELGEAEAAAHDGVVDFLDQAGFREVILVGPVFREAKVPGFFQVFSSVAACEVWLKEHPLKGRMILLKGSRGIGLEKLKDLL